MKKGEPRGALSEKESLIILEEYGIPVVASTVAAGEDEAEKAAKRFGYPVAVKALGRSLLHKSDKGLVHLNCNDASAVRQAVRAIQIGAGDELEAVLVAPQVPGTREFMAGFYRDKQFGPVILFGLGGVLTEALGDIAIRLAPLSPGDEEEMIMALRSRRLLDAFRGEAPAKHETLKIVLAALSRIAMERPDIGEIDINPLKVTPNGGIVAVDALVIRNDSEAVAEGSKPIDPGDIQSIFNPGSVAFVGASSQMGKWGHMLLVNTVAGGFEGAIHLVNPKGGTIAGREAYRSVEDIPGPVDLAVVTIPAAKVFELIPQFERKDIRRMILITSGFGELGEAGKDLERKVVEAARRADILIVGPNTMGISNPHIRFYCTGTPVASQAGSIAMIAQSGNLGVQLLAFAEKQGIGIRAFCGSGNEAMITIEDYIDGFTDDDATKTIMLYVESVKDGHRFYESARRVASKKPIVLLKGGESKAGNRAAASHTGAMASDSRVFSALCRQAGIVKVDQSTDLLDCAAAFSSLPLPRGQRVAVMTIGGGWGVVTADLCEAWGLELPPLPADIVRKFDAMLPDYWSRGNPVDIVGENNPLLPMTIIEELIQWDGCDAVINLGILGRRIFVNRLADSVRKADPTFSRDFLDYAEKVMSEVEDQYIARVARLMEEHNKPIYGVNLLRDEEDRTIYAVSSSRYQSVFFPSPERAVKACARMCQYYRFRQRLNTEP
ncbi:MAG: acetate--CoA ligase family protein [Deltaproteobacteria bacterium]|nr:acetate--CoA ligase family protein [Deltaproteobacteria bacterium]